MCAKCGCGHKNYQHEMVQMGGTFYQTEKVNYNMPKVPKVPPMPRTGKKAK